VFVYTEGNEQRFDRAGWAKYNYPRSHPRAIRPYFPDSIICVNGIQLDKQDGIFTMPMGARVDVRMKIDINLNRLRTKSPLTGLINHKLLLSSWSEILESHLKESKQAKLKNGWIYRQKLVKDFN